MSATLLDGKAFSAKVRARVASHVSTLNSEHGITPGLAVVLVGEDPASQVYVRSKNRQTVEAGMNSYEHKLDTSTSQDDLLALIAQLNADPAVHGILVQLPLPDHIEFQHGDQRDRTGQGRGRVHHRQCRSALHRPEVHGALHAARLPDAAARTITALSRE